MFILKTLLILIILYALAGAYLGLKTAKHIDHTLEQLKRDERVTKTHIFGFILGAYLFALIKGPYVFVKTWIRGY